MSLFTATTDYLLYFRDIVSGERFRSEQAVAADRIRELSDYAELSPPKDILDLGCGRLQPQSIIMSRWGYHVVGVDSADLESVTVQNVVYALLRRSLSFFTPREKSQNGSFRFLNCDVANIPCSDETFDLVISTAAFEHFLEVPKVVREMKRVLRPRGFFVVDIHNFTCLTGGHTVGMRLAPMNTAPAGIEPWDHLRERRVKPTVPLNEWRISQYKEAFAAEFSILKAYPRQTEGKELLTDEIRKILSDYSEEELVASCYRIIGRKEG